MNLIEKCKAAVADAEPTITNAQEVRAKLRRTTTPGSPEREEQIDAALEQIKQAMEPIRSLISRSLWQELPEKVDDALRDASLRCQYEAKQLKKMRRDA